MNKKVKLNKQCESRGVLGYICEHARMSFDGGEQGGYSLCIKYDHETSAQYPSECQQTKTLLIYRYRKFMFNRMWEEFEWRGYKVFGRHL